MFLSPFAEEEEELNPWKQLYYTVMSYIEFGAPEEFPEHFSAFIYFSLSPLIEHNLFIRINNTLSECYSFLIKQKPLSVNEIQRQAERFVSIIDLLYSYLDFEEGISIKEQDHQQLTEMCMQYINNMKFFEDEENAKTLSDKNAKEQQFFSIEQSHLLDFCNHDDFPIYLDMLLNFSDT